MTRSSRRFRRDSSPRRLVPRKRTDRALFWCAPCPVVLALITLLCAGLGVLVPEPVAAQSSIRLLPQVGLYAPLSELGEVRQDGQTAVEAGRRSASLAFGLGLEAGPAQRGTALRAHLGYGTSSDVPVGGFECEGCSGRSTLLTATAAAVFRPLPRLVLVQPHLVVGAGVKRYGFEPDDVRNDGWRDVLRDQTQPAGQLGVGLEVGLLGLRTQWELSGFVSRFRTGESGSSDPGRSGEETLQTDLFLTLAIPLGG